jgi:hypothetical protein
MESRNGLENRDEGAKDNQRSREHVHDKSGLRRRGLFEKLMQTSLPCWSDVQDSIVVDLGMW